MSTECSHNVEKTFYSRYYLYLFDIFQNHVKVSVKGFDGCKELLVVSAADEDFGTLPNSLCEQRQGALYEFLFLQGSDLLHCHFRL